MLRRVLCALVAVAPVRAHADGIAIVGGSPRAIGRAGAATVGDDGGGALLINPAAIARRDTLRVQLGVSANEDSMQWQRSVEAAPRSTGQAGSRLAPLGAVVAAVGPWSFGIGAMTAAVSARAFAPPDDVGGPLGSTYDYRYAGIAGSYRRDGLAVAAARRFGDSIALGLSITAARVTMTEQRRLWAGSARRDDPGNPVADVALRVEASAPLTTSVIAGVLYAPGSSQLELGASIGWAPTVALAGTVAAIGAPPEGPSIAATGSPTATLAVRQPVALRAGVRYVGERVAAELDGDLWLVSAGAASASWQIRGIRLVDAATAEVELRQAPSRLAQRSHGALRGSLDAELVPGFLWATGGYAYATAATPAARMSGTFGALAGHTLGLGLEVATGGVTVTLGWSRTWSVATHTASELRLDNPFGASDGPVPAGTYGGSLDQVGVMVELEVDPPARP